MEAAAAEAGPGPRHLHQQQHPQQQHQQQQLAAQRGLRQLAGGLPPAPGIPGLDVVRALHQTVISLRTALDSSREELRRLKEQQQQQQQEPDQAGDNCLDETVERLALENHVLRRRLLERAGEFASDAATSPPPPATETLAAATPQQLPLELAKMDAEPSSELTSQAEDGGAATGPEPEPAEATPAAEPEPNPAEEKPEEAEDKQVDEAGEDEAESGQPTSAAEENKLASQGVSNESENESEELDDIELIFTTEGTCPDVGLQEDLVSITDTEHWQQQQRTPTPNEQHKSVLKIGQAKSADGSELVCNGNGGAMAPTLGANAEKANSVDEAASSQSSSIDREESVDRFDESSSSRLNKMWSQCSVLVETDISKCGVLEEADLTARHAARRNTLAAPPTAYRPIIHREALAAGRRKSAAPLRPVMDRSGGATPGTGARRESGAQTDISALPAQWRSESYLAHKVAHTFTTLPSKFALPAGVSGRLRLSDKTREARRVMLSDISFTSMVPELSRSADHLCHDPHAQFPQPHCYSSRGGLRTPESNRRESWARSGGGAGGGLPSPCECRLSTDLYSARYRGSLSSISSPAGGDFGPSRRHSWRPNAAASFDGWRTPAVATVSPAQSGAVAVAGASQLTRPTWSSMPSSPTHVQPPSAAVVARLAGNPPRRTRSKVTFQGLGGLDIKLKQQTLCWERQMPQSPPGGKECPLIRGSLPNLRTDLLAENSGDSTESLLDEAEDYLRRSIDSMLTISTGHEHCPIRHAVRRRRARRHSEPDLFREWQPPQDARPYLPKMPRDLKLDHLVKVISPEGKILQGRVRYVGPVAGREDVHVGVELVNDGGTSDGTFHGRRYFDCEPERAVFVPFKKVVLAWCTT